MDRGKIAAEGLHCAGYGAPTYYAIWFNAVFNASMLFSFVGVLDRNKKRPAGGGSSKPKGQ